MESQLTGLIAAPFTGMFPDGSLNLGVIESQAAHLQESGVAGAFICGTTGEGISLSLSERQKVATEWSKVRGNLKLVVHIAHPCVEDAHALAAHAQHIGANAIAAMPVSPLRPTNTEDLVDWCAAIASAAPELPFYYYHIPSISKVDLKVRDLFVRGAERIPNLAGCKFTYEDLWDFSRCHSLQAGRFDMLFGRDEIMLAGAALGARGFVGSTYNFAAPLYLEVLKAVQENDLATARLWQNRASEVVALLVESGGLPAMKALMSFIGLELGPMRLPFRPLTSTEIDSMVQKLDVLGYFQFIEK